MVATTVHPRWRGEHETAERDTGKFAGSSPLARGTLFGRRIQALHKRFVPAGAGNTQKRDAHYFFSRFIPAGAGNASDAGRVGAGVTVHPRWRGERNAGRATGCHRNGSSPLARGTRLGAKHAPPLLRFIPAGAGNACCDVVLHVTSPVHPRWRGEHLLVADYSRIFSGSSPLARGTRHH